MLRREIGVSGLVALKNLDLLSIETWSPIAADPDAGG